VLASETFKAPPRRCGYCGTEMAAQPSSAGRPRTYCSRPCLRDWHTLKEHYERERESDEKRERQYYEMTRGWYGKREADKLARERAKKYEARQRIRELHLKAPWKSSD
jgi:hypothetical protein